MTDLRELQRRSNALREPPAKPARNPVRPEAPGGRGERWVVIRSVNTTTGTMMAQGLRYRTPRKPLEGDVEAFGAEFEVFPMMSYRYQQYAGLVFTEESEASAPLGVRVYPVRAVNIGGSWLLDIPFSMPSGVTKGDPTDPFAASTG